ncbi:hypothetical protein [Niveibacterium sp. SC-1]|uniref:hypothetical protein n=1 Tax=Niveibacterium sp. SC-1 TaxID=3135646 RepID=UPI00311F3172
MPPYVLFRTGVLFLGLLTSAAAMAQNVPLTHDNYAQEGARKGVVLMSVRWDRKWNCAGYENAQLRVLGFDRLPSQHAAKDERADLLLDDAPLVMTKPVFDDYAFLVEPGEYALSRLQIKAAKSVSDIRYSKVERDRLLKDGQPQGGTFRVDAGELVYIGHFYLDCYKEPAMWRYYMEGRAAFDEYLAGWTKKFPELDAARVQFRLFKSPYFGRDYALE